MADQSQIVRPIAGSASPAPDDRRDAGTQILADATIGLKSLEGDVLNAHWRIRGPEFVYLHPWLGQYAEALRGYADQTAERVAAMGGDAPAIPSGQEMPRDATSICSQLLDSTRELIRRIGRGRAQAEAQRMLDTFDLLTQIIRGLEEKWGWALAAICEDMSSPDSDASGDANAAQLSKPDPDAAPPTSPSPSGAQAEAPKPGDPPMVAPDAHMIGDSSSSGITEAVYEQLAEDFPPEAIAWVRSATWRGPVSVAVSQMDFSSRDKWAASGEPVRVDKMRQKIAKGQLKPIILVNEPTNSKMIIVDGHHRALAYEKLGRPALAYIADVGAVNGPWDQMHDQEHEPDSDREPLSNPN